MIQFGHFLLNFWIRSRFFNQNWSCE